MKKRALIVYRVDKEDPSNIGVLNKLRGQAEGLKYNNWDVDCICHDRQHIFLNSTRIHKRKRSFSYIFFKWNFYNYLINEKTKDYNLYIIRYGPSTAPFIKWLKFLKNKSKSIKIIIDMPTYPYVNEWKGLYGKMVLFLDSIYHRELYKYIDTVLHSGEESSIYKIATFKLSNGINTDIIPIRNPIKKAKLHFVAMAKWQYWHGLDRLFIGLRKYLDKGGEPIVVDVLGDGPNKNQLMQMVEQLELGTLVQFHGVKYGYELDTFFDSADLGIGTLGMHRKGIMVDCSLKHREYVARGLPFVMSGEDFDIKKGTSFVHHVKPDNSLVDIHELIDFINRLKTSDILIQKMRSFAVSELSWNVKMRDLVKSL